MLALLWARSGPVRRRSRVFRAQYKPPQYLNWPERLGGRKNVLARERNGLEKGRGQRGSGQRKVGLEKRGGLGLEK